jgi:hypothetical protein
MSWVKEIEDVPLIFRPEIIFDGDDVVIWGDEGKKHFRVVIRVVKSNRHIFQNMAQDAYNARRPELMIGE